MSAARQSKHIVTRINTTLARFFRQYGRQAARQHPIARELVRAVSEFTQRRGAKRIRGLLVVAGYLSNPRSRISADILAVAAGYEVLHAYLLIHDDLIDEDDERRGEPTLHRVFERLAPRGSRKLIREKIGRDIAVIAGDVAADLVQRIILDTNFTDQQKLRALAQIEETLHTTYAGQVLDILSIPQRPPSRADQILRYELKTARYSIMAPFELGATLSAARYDTTAFRRFALDAGVAFQLADDIENVFGRGLAARSSDVRSGKVTLLMTLAFQSTAYRARLIRILKKPTRTAQDIRQLRRLIRESGGLERATDLVTSRYARAGRQVPKLRVSTFSRVLLQQMIDRFSHQHTY